MLDIQEVLAKFRPNQKINYDKVLQKVIAGWQQQAERPKILLHSCCGPCSTYPLEYLSQYADLTIYFANSNIHPQEEYLRREQVQRDFIQDFNAKTGNHVEFLAAPYEPNAFIAVMTQAHLTQEPEGGARCSACFQMRLDLVAEKALALGYDYFGSALTLSPKKNSTLINEIGIEVQEIYNVHYLPSDFKKNNGYPRSIELCKEYDVYRQCYCGCVFAAKAQGVDLKEVKRAAKTYLAAKEAQSAAAVQINYTQLSADTEEAK